LKKKERGPGKCDWWLHEKRSKSGMGELAGSNGANKMRLSQCVQVLSARGRRRKVVGRQFFVALLGKRLLDKRASNRMAPSPTEAFSCSVPS